MKIFANIFFLKLFLRLHTYLYKISGFIAAYINNGTHPKHDIIQYKEWFVDNIEEYWIVLDIGCNTGKMPFELSKKAKFVYGIEIDEKFVREAIEKRSSNNIKYFCSDATKFDYSQINEIDCVTLSNVLEHIEDRIGFLKTLIRKINWKNKVKFFIRVPMIDRDWIVIYKKGMRIEYRLDNTHYIEYDFESFNNEMNEVGLKIISSKVKFGELFAICEKL